jgi:hypothetical protein
MPGAMTDAPEYLKMALEAEAQAAVLPPGFERDELLRRASAWRDIADLLQAQEERRRPPRTAKRSD